MSFRAIDLFNLVNDFGETLTLRKTTTSGTYDTSTGRVTGSATTDYVAKGYFFNNDIGLMLNSKTSNGDRYCVFSSVDLPVEPDTDDQVVGNGDTVNIVRVSTIFSGGSSVCYICEVRE